MIPLVFLALAATGCMFAGVAVGYFLGHRDGFEAGWIERSYTPDPPAIRRARNN